MSSHKIDLLWENKDPARLDYETYSRDHVLYFGGKQTLVNSASIEFKGTPDAANPEELLAAALASCHMLTFLAIASKTGYLIKKYSCQAEALLNKNENGKMAVTEINLRPVIEFNGEKIPNKEQLAKMHDKAHHNCFIAQSIQAKVNIL